MTQTLETPSPYLADFEQTAQAAGPSWLEPMRRAAFSQFEELGFPTRRHEEWRFTDIRPIVETTFALAEPSEVTPQDIAEFTFAGPQAALLVFVNGRYSPALSNVGELPSGIRAGSLAEALRTDPAIVETHLARYAGVNPTTFTALNTAFLNDGAFVRIPRNVLLEQPIHLLFLATPSAHPAVSHPRVLIVAEENSQAAVVESYAGQNGAIYFTNAVTEVVLGANAIVDHCKIQRESFQAYHIATMQLQLAQGSNFASHNVALGGGIVRNEVNAVLGGENIECTLNGVYLANGKRLIDNHTAIDHAMPHCDSHENYKGILDGQARGVFNGKIFVRQDAQKTDAKQTNKTLLLSEDAQINTKPQLEIFADDVKCTHGATVGQLDEDAVFYLRSRGIGETEARNLLTYAFASDIISRIKIEAVRARLDEVLRAQLP